MKKLMTILALAMIFSPCVHAGKLKGKDTPDFKGNQEIENYVIQYVIQDLRFISKFCQKEELNTKKFNWLLEFCLNRYCMNLWIQKNTKYILEKIKKNIQIEQLKYNLYIRKSTPPKELIEINTPTNTFPPIGSNPEKQYNSGKQTPNFKGNIIADKTKYLQNIFIKNLKFFDYAELSEEKIHFFISIFIRENLKNQKKDEQTIFEGIIQNDTIQKLINQEFQNHQELTESFQKNQILGAINKNYPEWADFPQYEKLPLVALEIYLKLSTKNSSDDVVLNDAILNKTLALISQRIKMWQQDVCRQDGILVTRNSSRTLNNNFDSDDDFDPNTTENEDLESQKENLPLETIFQIQKNNRKKIPEFHMENSQKSTGPTRIHILQLR